MVPTDDNIAAPQENASGVATSGADEAITLEEAVRQCCIDTINVHARFNPMMVCSECKHIIKCFKDEAAYSKYLQFCQSRKRQVSIGRVDDYHTIIFKSYDGYR